MSFDHERQAIIGVLEFAGRVLEHLISKLDPNAIPDFQDTWSSETKPQLDQAIRMMQGEPSEDDTRVRAYELYEERGRAAGHDAEDWERAESELRENLRAENGPFHRLLRRVGLAGKSLKLKLTHLAEAAIKGVPAKLLKLLNKFLGSLAKASIFIEAVKEFKEWLEELVLNPDQYDSAVVNIYSQSGPDPFCLKKL